MVDESVFNDENINEELKEDIEKIIEKRNLNSIERKNKLLSIMKKNKDTNSNLLGLYKKIIFNILLNDASDANTSEFLDDIKYEYNLDFNKKLLNDTIIEACLPATEEYLNESGFLDILNEKYLKISEKLNKNYNKLLDIEYDGLDYMDDLSLEKIINNPNLNKDLDRIVKFIIDNNISSYDQNKNKEYEGLLNNENNSKNINFFDIVSEAITNRKLDIDEKLFGVNNILNTASLDVTDSIYNDYGLNELINDIRLFIINNYKKVIDTKQAFIELYIDLIKKLNRSDKNYSSIQKNMIFSDILDIGKKYGIDIKELSNLNNQEIFFTDTANVLISKSDDSRINNTVIKIKMKKPLE